MNGSPIFLHTLDSHFDPLTLSIVEATENSGWRERVKSNCGKWVGNIPSFAPVERADLFAQLTSMHEHDHFVRHSSSELGMLITLLLAIRYHVLIGLWYLKQGRKGVSVALHTLRENQSWLDRMYCALCVNDMTISQGQAIEDFNRFFSAHFGVDGPVLMTETPWAPACPGSCFSYRQLLEASAVLGELMHLEFHGPRSDELARLLQPEARDPDLYFALPKWTVEQLYGILPAAAITIRLAFDVRVPFFGSPYSGPIMWKDFHPGFRVVEMVHWLRAALKHHRLDEVGSRPGTETHQYVADFQMYILKELCRGCKAGGNLRLWFDDDVQAFDCSADGFAMRLSPNGKALLTTTVLRAAKPIMDHLCEAFCAFRDVRLRDPLQFYGSSAFTFLKSDHPYLDAFRPLLQVSAALFSIIDETVNSVHWDRKGMDVMLAMLFRVKNEIVERLLRGESESTVRSLPVHKLKWPDDRLRMIFEEWLEELYRHLLNPTGKVDSQEAN